MKKITIAVIALWVSSSLVWAMPTQITFQGTLKQQGVPVNTPRNMVFSFVDGSGATIPGTIPIPVANVQVNNGLFAVQLPLDPSIPWEQYTPFIQVSVGGEILSPNQPINANLYAAAAIPQGLIAMFASSCPIGWSVFTGLQGKFPVGADNSTFSPAGSTGGALSHTHSTPNHQHTLASTDSISGGCGFGPVVTDAGGNLAVVPSGGGCAGNKASATTTSSGGGTTGSASSLPPYLTVVFCQKL